MIPRLPLPLALGLAPVLALAAAEPARAQTAWPGYSTSGAEQPPVQPQAPPTVAPPAPVAAGEWVYTDAYGWAWVPAGATPYTIEDQPLVYLYTPLYGWTWYTSPWGWGPFYYGPWVHRRWGWRWAPHVWGGGAWMTPRYGVPPVYRGGVNVAPPSRYAPPVRRAPPARPRGRR